MRELGSVFSIMGCRQAVRQRTLTPSSRGFESRQPSQVYLPKMMQVRKKPGIPGFFRVFRAKKGRHGVTFLNDATQAVLPVGDLLWRAVHSSGQRKPACGIRWKEHLGESHPGEVPDAEARAASHGRNPGGSAGSTAQTAGHQSPRQCAHPAKNGTRKGEGR